ncbi:MAG: bifunctional 4-hydroxy-2-oxoglutarate aldolase/2-dehydro-3-deoxy-phosphogluconate aldolase [Puniceicoccaceae bacterium]
MAAFPPALLSRLEKSRVVAGFSVEAPEDAVPLAEALLQGGIDVIELTLRTKAGIEAVALVHEKVPDICAGVGTILTPEQVLAVKQAGADFGVSPGMNPRVVKASVEADLPFAPGICTPSDIESAVELGCQLLKYFPAESSGGLNHLRSMGAPYKHLGLRYFPLGGVNAANMLEYLSEPMVAAVGGSWIVQPDLVKNKDWSAIRDRATAVRKALDAGLTT